MVNVFAVPLSVAPKHPNQTVPSHAQETTPNPAAAMTFSPSTKTPPSPPSTTPPSTITYQWDVIRIWDPTAAPSHGNKIKSPTRTSQSKHVSMHAKKEVMHLQEWNSLKNVTVVLFLVMERRKSTKVIVKWPVMGIRRSSVVVRQIFICMLRRIFWVRILVMGIRGVRVRSLLLLQLVRVRLLLVLRVLRLLRRFL